MEVIRGDSNGFLLYILLLGDCVGENGIVDFNSVYYGEVVVVIDKLYQGNERFVVRYFLGSYDV